MKMPFQGLFAWQARVVQVMGDGKTWKAPKEKPRLPHGRTGVGVVEKVRLGGGLGRGDVQTDAARQILVIGDVSEQPSRR